MEEKFLKEVNKDIYSLVYKIKNCKSKSRYYQLITDLNAIYDMCDYLKITDIPDINNYSHKFGLEDYYKNNVRHIINDLKVNYDYYLKVSAQGTKLINKFDLSRNYNYNYQLKNYFNCDDGFKLAISFLEKYDIDILNSLFEVIRNNRALIGTSLDDQNYGTTYMLTETNYPYLIIDSKNKINLPFSIVHEAGHIHNLKLYKNNSYKIIDRNNLEGNYQEVYSNYLELKFADYLIKNNLYNEDVRLIKKCFYLDLANKLEVFHNMLKTQNIKDLNHYNMLITNMFGKLIACYYDEFNDLETKENLKQFLISCGNYENIEVLNKFGLNKDKLCDSKILEKKFEKEFKNGV